jgi:hypothetical protein
MSNLLSHEVYHPSIGDAFGELLVLEQISQLPPDSILRILQTIPKPLLRHALAGSGEAAEERRSQSRRKVLRGARLLCGGQLVLEVQLRDISEGGCRIWTRRPEEVPDRFTLRIVGEAGERDCELRWRDGEEMGIRFLERCT